MSSGNFPAGRVHSVRVIFIFLVLRHHSRTTSNKEANRNQNQLENFFIIISFLLSLT